MNECAKHRCGTVGGGAHASAAFAAAATKAMNGQCSSWPCWHGKLDRKFTNYALEAKFSATKVMYDDVMEGVECRGCVRMRVFVVMCCVIVVKYAN